MLISVVVVLAACQKSLPTAPSDWSTGIIIYEHANYLGKSALVDRDLANLSRRLRPRWLQRLHRVDPDHPSIAMLF
jgi:hypothetical protein